ncbi:hypothetical protein ACIRPH_26565 [Nocardiopsis sp. NPDC101807]|uniref:hypothetical protein n=1 Tax=Nocardiopsis sp. NPDC101807 TaxID=3364339 RepID=UPI00381D8DE4
MSLMFMLFALLGSIVVLAAGSLALRRVVAYLNDRLVVAEEPAPRVEPERHVGGYVPVPRGSEDLPPSLRARVHDLVALGRGEEAVRAVRERLGADEARARRIVAGLEGDGTGSGRALEP